MADSLTLKRGKDRKIRGGHPWIKVQEVQGSLKSYKAGELLRVLDSQGAFLAWAGFSRGSQICARILDRRETAPGDQAWFMDRIRVACERRSFLSRETCRLVSAEADDLPGLLIDCYGSLLRVQCLSRFMEDSRPHIAAALADLFQPEYLFFDASSCLRRAEALDQFSEFWSPSGEAWRQVRIADDHESVPVIQVELAGLTFGLDACNVEPGWPDLDQAENWQRVAQCARKGSVLDLCSREGAWGLAAARAGAASITFVDKSRQSLSSVENNWKLNGFPESTMICRQGETAELLQELSKEAERFRLVCLDPAADVMSRKRIQGERKDVIQLNRLALHLVEHGGFLATFNRSGSIGWDAFREYLRLSARKARRRIRILSSLEQATDHPRLPQMLETTQFKGFLLQVEDL